MEGRAHVAQVVTTDGLSGLNQAEGMKRYSVLSVFHK